MTVGLCLDHCQQQQMMFAGLIRGNRCYCGNDETNINLSERRRDRDCNRECSGNKDEVCGARATISLYNCKSITFCKGIHALLESKDLYTIICTQDLFTPASFSSWHALNDTAKVCLRLPLVYWSVVKKRQLPTRFLIIFIIRKAI